LVQEIEGHTIENILATSDLELGIEALLGLRQGEGDTLWVSTMIGTRTKRRRSNKVTVRCRRAHEYHRKIQKASTARRSPMRTRSDRPGVSVMPDGR
jgi:hypothetical protein